MIDPRGRFLTPERFPKVTLDDRRPDEALTALKPDRATTVVPLGHDPGIDDAVLAAPAGHVAALDSRRSHAARLALARFGPGDPDRIAGPAGLDRGAIGPAEIALPIAAAIVKHCHAGA